MGCSPEYKMNADRISLRMPNLPILASEQDRDVVALVDVDTHPQDLRRKRRGM